MYIVTVCHKYINQDIKRLQAHGIRGTVHELMQKHHVFHIVKKDLV